MSAIAILLCLAIGYVAFISISMVLSQPVRLKLVEITTELAEEPGRSKAEKAELNWLVSSSMSTAVGWFLPVAAIAALAASLLGAEDKSDASLKRLQADPRFDQVVGLYFVSIMACSPIAGIIAAPIVVACGIAVSLRSGKGLIKSAETPIMKASAQFQHC